MHELSIAMSIVELAEEEAQRREVWINVVHLKLGALSGVVREALLSCYEMACEGTALQGSRLEVEDVPVVIFCSSCQSRRPLSSMQLFVARNAVLRVLRSCKEKKLKLLPWRYRNAPRTPFD